MENDEYAYRGREEEMGKYVLKFRPWFKQEPGTAGEANFFNLCGGKEEKRSGLCGYRVFLEDEK